MIKLLPLILLNFLFVLEAKPASVHTTNFEEWKSFIIFSSSGFIVICSLVLPANIPNDIGMPSPSKNKPIWVIGVGLFSFDLPYCLKPLSSSISKKKFVQS